jgi:hypothetical protein
MKLRYLAATTTLLSIAHVTLAIATPSQTTYSDNLDIAATTPVNVIANSKDGKLNIYKDSSTHWYADSTLYAANNNNYLTIANTNNPANNCVIDLQTSNSTPTAHGPTLYSENNIHCDISDDPNPIGSNNWPVYVTEN